jgi:hypothetical protein
MGTFPQSAHVSICFAHHLTSEVFNIFHRGHANYELGNHVTPTVCFPKAIFNTVTFFSHFRVKLDADMLLFQVYFLSTPKSQVEQHTTTLKKTTLSNNTCYGLT